MLLQCIIEQHLIHKLYIFCHQILLKASQTPRLKTNLCSTRLVTYNIFTFGLQEDQRHKIGALDFEDKSDTIAQCDVNAFKGNTCYKFEGEGHFIKDCPLNKDNPTQNQRKQYTPYNKRSTSNITDVITAIAQTLNSLFKQLKQLNTSNKITHNSSSHHKSHHNNTDRHRHNHHNRDTKHNSHSTYNRHKTYCENRHNKGYHNRHNNRTMVKNKRFH